jgi:hypothetical protein
MSDDPFAAPSSEFDDTIRNRARNNLYMAAASAIGLSFLQFCCNPCMITTIAAVASNLNAIRQPKWMEISLDEDYPSDAGMVSRIAGYVGLVLCGFWILIQILAIALQVGLIASGEF